MKVSITKEELVKCLSVVSKGMSSRSTLPILSGMLLSAYDKELTFQTTDLEISIKTTATIFLEEEGSVVVPGKLFTDIVHNLPDAAVQLSTQGETFIIECMSSRFDITSTLPVVDFPHFPEVVAEKKISLPSQKAAEMVRQVAKAISKDESRAVLTGIYFSAEKDTLQFVATDSYRLAVAKCKTEIPISETIDAIIPGKVFEDVMKSATSEDEILLGITENQIVFEFGSTIFITRRIEGNYPNFEQLIPNEKNISAKVSTGAMLDAIKRVSLLAQSHAPVKFVFSSEKQNIEVSSQAQDVGGAVESVSAEIEGETVEIGFNHQFIVDGLTSIPEEETQIEVQSSLKPGIFKTTNEDTSFLYLVMPVRLG